MVICNNKIVHRVKLTMIRIPLLVSLIILVLQMFELIHLPGLLIASASLTVVLLLLTLILRMNFIEASCNEGNVIIKYYTLFPLIREYRKIQIPKSHLSSFRISRKRGSWVETLELEANTTHGSAIYPEISLSLLNKTEREQLKQMIIQCR